jgi:hypothetical protein
LKEKPNKGVVYIATKEEKYVAEAFLSATSVKELVPDLHVTLFTNLKDSAFARDDCFDTVVPIDTIRDYGKSWSEGQLDRIRCLPKSPYEHTLHLDSDTRVMSPEIADVFSLLESHDIAMVECLPENSYSCEQYGRPMFNVGFILYRKSGGVMDLLFEWERLTATHFAIARDRPAACPEWLSHITDAEVRRNLLFMDQLSMVRLLSPEVNRFGVDCKVLEHSWNYRGTEQEPASDVQIRVNHHPDLRGDQFKRDIAAAGSGFAESGDKERALQIFEAALDQWPGDMDFMRFIVLTHVNSQDLDTARRWLEAMLDQFPGHPWATDGLQALARMESSG